MGNEPSVVEVEARPLLAIRQRIRWNQIGEVAMPSLDRVWRFIRERGIEGVGANIFVYRGLGVRGADVTFGVEVPEGVEPADGLVRDATPSGKAATVAHMGSYDRLMETNERLHKWCAEHKQKFNGTSWEIYGDWSEDPAQLRTDIFHQLKT